jgi:hypothetical protein
MTVKVYMRYNSTSRFGPGLKAIGLKAIVLFSIFSCLCIPTLLFTDRPGLAFLSYLTGSLALLAVYGFGGPTTVIGFLVTLFVMRYYFAPLVVKAAEGHAIWHNLYRSLETLAIVTCVVLAMVVASRFWAETLNDPTTAVRTYEATVSAQGHHLHYFTNYYGGLERFAILPDSDRLINGTILSNEYGGWWTITWAFAMVPPRLVYPEQPFLGPGAYLGHVAGLGYSLDDETQWMTGLPAESYHAFSYLGVFFGDRRTRSFFQRSEALQVSWHLPSMANVPCPILLVFFFRGPLGHHLIHDDSSGCAYHSVGPHRTLHKTLANHGQPSFRFTRSS